MTYSVLYNIITDNKIIAGRLILVEKNKIHFTALMVNGFKTITQYIIHLHNMRYRLGLWRITIICKTHLYFITLLFYFPTFRRSQTNCFHLRIKNTLLVFKTNLDLRLFMNVILLLYARCAIHFQQSLYVFVGRNSFKVSRDYWRS